MPYVNRDTGGDITAVFNRRQYEGQEQIAEAHADITDWRLAAARREKKLAIQYEYEVRKSADYTFNSKDYQVSDNIRDGLNYINSGETSIDWTATDNTRSTFTAADFQSMAQGIFERGQALFLTMRTKKAAVDVLSTVNEVNNYDETSGW